MSAVTPFDFWTKFRGTAFDGRRVIIKYDYDGATDGKPRYIGIALAGSADSDKKWFISRFTYDGDRQMTIWETSNNNVKWDDRATTPYNVADPS